MVKEGEDSFLSEWVGGLGWFGLVVLLSFSRSVFEFVVFLLSGSGCFSSSVTVSE